MNVIRLAQKLQIKTKDNNIIHGFVSDYTFDRIMIKIADDDVNMAKSLKELDDIFIIISTHLGIKHMNSTVITQINSNNSIIVENNKMLEVEQKREFVRVVSNLKFVVEFDLKIINCQAINISAGGIAFKSDTNLFKVDDKIKIKFSEKDLGKNIICNAIIIKVQDSMLVAKYTDLNPHDEDKIMGYVFKLITYKDKE